MPGSDQRKADIVAEMPVQHIQPFHKIGGHIFPAAGFGIEENDPVLRGTIVTELVAEEVLCKSKQAFKHIPVFIFQYTVHKFNVIEFAVLGVAVYMQRLPVEQPAVMAFDQEIEIGGIPDLVLIFG